LEVGLSATITNEGLFEEALISPHDPSSKENLTPLTVRISVIACSSIRILFFFIFSIFLTNSSTT
jgi:hypothetical protein